MSEPNRTKTAAPRMPLWFRLAVVGMLTVLLVPWMLLRSDGGRAALARTFLVPGGQDVGPILDTQAALLGRRSEPPQGAYRLNGMLVKYRTFYAREGLNQTLARFREAFDQAGYVQKLTRVQKQPTLVAIHPETHVMLTVRPGIDRENGRLTLRLSEQDLSELAPGFRAKLPGVPSYPGARIHTLIEPVDDEPTRSLTYLVKDSSDWVMDFYAEKLAEEGWARLVPPVDKTEGRALEVAFFVRDGVELSVLLLEPEGSPGTFVMLNMTGNGTREL